MPLALSPVSVKQIKINVSYAACFVNAGYSAAFFLRFCYAFWYQYRLGKMSCNGMSLICSR